MAAKAKDLEEKVERLKKIKSKIDTKSVALNYILEVSRLLPVELVVTGLTFQKDDSLVIKGRAAEMSDIFKFITTLDASPYFQQVQTRYTTRKKIKNQDINEFEIVGLIDTKKTVSKKRPARPRAAAETP
jgi:Tfp pilus assembly protein PilN